MASVLADLRALMPQRPVSIDESLRIAELQAAHLLEARGASAAPVDDGVVSELPRLRVERTAPLPVSGSTHWSKGIWWIVLNGDEAFTRQRFSLAHEFKHVLDAPFVHYLYPEEYGVSSHERAERVADFFAACVLMPRPWVKRLFGRGEHDARELAATFNVSPAAMRYRLHQLGLVEPSRRWRVAA